MHSFFKQVFYEGLGAAIYEPIEKIINKLHNKLLTKSLIIIWKILYICLLLFIAFLLLYISYPFK